MLPMVSVVVPAKNEEKVIEKCIKSLINLSYPKNRLEIVVATDGNTDRTLKICKKYEPKIKVIETKPTRCKAEALNAVIPKLKGEIIAIFDADCVVDKNCVANAVKRFSDKEVMGVMGFLRPYNKQQNIITKMIFSETILVFFQESIINKLGLNPNFLGKNMFFRREVFKKIGKFDEYSYSEDIEFSIEMRKYKYKVVLEKSAITYDEYPTSISDILKQRLRFFRGMLRVKRKMSYKSKKDIFQDLAHGFFIYTSSLSSIMLFTLLFSLVIKMPTIIVNLGAFILLLQFLLFLISTIFLKEPLKNLLFTPLYLIFSILNFYSLFNAWYKEKTGASIKWYKVNRAAIKQ